MKKISICFLVFSFLIFFSFSNQKIFAEGDFNKQNDITLPEDLQEQMDTQAEIFPLAFEAINQNFGNLDAFDEIGIIYSDNKGGVTFGINELDTHNKSNAEKEDKIKKFKEDIEKMKVKIKEKNKDKLSVIPIDYTMNDLKDLQGKLLQDLKELNVTGENNHGVKTSILLKDRKISLTVGSLAESSQEYLIQKYGDKLEIEVDFTFKPEKTIERKRNWTKLGAGISMHDAYAGDCTVGALGTKGATYYIITAGHCLSNDDSRVYQHTSSAFVGYDHDSGYPRGYDIGLVRVSENSFLKDAYANKYSRFVTNYLYKHAEDNNDYDARMTSWSNPVYNAAVCKSGITSRVTCGTITDTSTTVDYDDPEPAQEVVEVATISTHYYTFAEKGDSGGPVFYNSSNSLVGIVSGRAGTSRGFFTKVPIIINAYSSPGMPFSIYTSNYETKVGPY